MCVVVLACDSWARPSFDNAAQVCDETVLSRAFALARTDAAPSLLDDLLLLLCALLRSELPDALKSRFVARVIPDTLNLLKISQNRTQLNDGCRELGEWVRNLHGQLAMALLHGNGRLPQVQLLYPPPLELRACASVLISPHQDQYACLVALEWSLLLLQTHLDGISPGSDNELGDPLAALECIGQWVLSEPDLHSCTPTPTLRRIAEVWINMASLCPEATSPAATRHLACELLLLPPLEVLAFPTETILWLWSSPDLDTGSAANLAQWAIHLFGGSGTTVTGTCTRSLDRSGTAMANDEEGNALLQKVVGVCASVAGGRVLSTLLSQQLTVVDSQPGDWLPLLRLLEAILARHILHATSCQPSTEVANGPSNANDTVAKLSRLFMVMPAGDACLAERRLVLQLLTSLVSTAAARTLCASTLLSTLHHTISLLLPMLPRSHPEPPAAIASDTGGAGAGNGTNVDIVTGNGTFAGAGNGPITVGNSLPHKMAAPYAHGVKRLRGSGSAKFGDSSIRGGGCSLGTSAASCFVGSATLGGGAHRSRRAQLSSSPEAVLHDQLAAAVRGGEGAETAFEQSRSKAAADMPMDERLDLLTFVNVVIEQYEEALDALSANTDLAGGMAQLLLLLAQPQASKRACRYNCALFGSAALFLTQMLQRLPRLHRPTFLLDTLRQHITLGVLPSLLRMPLSRFASALTLGFVAEMLRSNALNTQHTSEASLARDWCPALTSMLLNASLSRDDALLCAAARCVDALSTCTTMPPVMLTELAAQPWNSLALEMVALHHTQLTVAHCAYWSRLLERRPQWTVPFFMRKQTALRRFLCLLLHAKPFTEAHLRLLDEMHTMCAFSPHYVKEAVELLCFRVQVLCSRSHDRNHQIVFLL